MEKARKKRELVVKVTFCPFCEVHLHEMGLVLPTKNVPKNLTYLDPKMVLQCTRCGTLYFDLHVELRGHGTTDTYLGLVPIGVVKERFIYQYPEPYSNKSMPPFKPGDKLVATVTPVFAHEEEGKPIINRRTRTVHSLNFDDKNEFWVVRFKRGWAHYPAQCFKKIGLADSSTESNPF